jgi:hypothetical protein
MNTNVVRGEAALMQIAMELNIAAVHTRALHICHVLNLFIECLYLSCSPDPEDVRGQIIISAPARSNGAVAAIITDVIYFRNPQAFSTQGLIEIGAIHFYSPFTSAVLITVNALFVLELHFNVSIPFLLVCETCVSSLDKDAPVLTSLCIQIHVPEDNRGLSSQILLLEADRLPFSISTVNGRLSSWLSIITYCFLPSRSV